MTKSIVHAVIWEVDNYLAGGPPVREAPNRSGRPAEKRRARLRRYGLTEQDYADLLERQNGRCAICRRTPEQTDPHGRALAVDHDHDTGHVRGLLCIPCNRGGGLFRDDPDILQRASEYLAVVALSDNSCDGLVAPGLATHETTSSLSFLRQEPNEKPLRPSFGSYLRSEEPISANPHG